MSSWTPDKEKIFTPDDLKKLMKYIEEQKIIAEVKRRTSPIHHWMVFSIAEEVGPRISEILQCQVKQVIFSTKGMSYFNIRQRKGSRNNPPVFFTKDLEKKLKWYFRWHPGHEYPPKPEDFLIMHWSVRGQNYVPYSRQALDYAIRKYCLAAGLSKIYSMHSFRHAMVSDMILSHGEKGLAVASKQAGHSSIAITSNYLSILEEDAKEALKAMKKRRG